MNRHRLSPGIVREQWPLLLLITAMFLILFAQELGPADWADPFMVVPARIVESSQHLRAGAVEAHDLGNFGTLLSHAFLHGDIGHVFSNMLFIWIFGALIVEYLGHRWIALIFILSAIGGGIAHTVLNLADTIPMLGASGALMGIEGAYFGLTLTRRLPDPHIWPMAHPIPPAHLAGLAVVGLAFDFRDVFAGEADFIAHGAHIGGFVVGFFITSIALPGDAGR
jgi:membrane associated rhomboid family serine protease